MSVSAVGSEGHSQVAALQAAAKPAQVQSTPKVEAPPIDTVEISGQAKQLSESIISE